MSDILHTFGLNVASSLELQCSTKSAREKAYNHAKAVAAFDALVAGIQTGARKPPTVTQVVMFTLFKYISEVYPKEFSADHRYYRDKTGYYDDSKVSFWKKMIARRVLKDFDKDVAANR
jgi:hypothetical protein